MTREERLEACIAPLISWFMENQREMPWRSDPKAYHVWVSEIMLQQTRVEAVRPYYKRFLETLPNMEALAKCSEEQLLKLWEGLGYYSRVRNMKKAAMVCMEQYGGTLPSDYAKLMKLPGIGSYTAGAISSIAFLEPNPVVDGNVLRVISRLLADRADISLDTTKKAMEQTLSALLLKKRPNPSLFNQGLMELGALICVPNGEPKCEQCPWNELCISREENLTDVIPVKTGKKPRKTENKTVLHLFCEKRRGIQKRPSSGLLAGLYELPNMEGHLTKKQLTDFLYHEFHIAENKDEIISVEKISSGKHIFSHVEWNMWAYTVTVKKEFQEFLGRPLYWVEKEKLKSSYALPGAFKKWDEKG